MYLCYQEDEAELQVQEILFEVPEEENTNDVDEVDDGEVDEEMDSDTEMYLATAKVEEEYAKNSGRTDALDLRKCTRVYIGGYIMKQVLKVLKNCKKCKFRMIGNEKSTKNVELLLARSYTKTTRLNMPSNTFVNIFNECYNTCKQLLPKICLKRGITSILKKELSKFAKPFDRKCPNHDCKLNEVFLSAFINFYINVWCRNVNNILNGKVSLNVNDDVKKLALKRYKTYRQKKRAIYKVKKLS